MLLEGKPSASSMIIPDNWPRASSSPAEGRQHVLIGHFVGAFGDDCLRRVEELAVNNGPEHAVCTDPDVRGVDNVLSFQLKRRAIPNIVSDILFIDQDLMDRTFGPRAVEIGMNSSRI